jgi:hypothetical protein
MAYLRRQPRSAFECPLILDVPPHPGVPGEACDLGLSGIGLIVSTRVPRGSQVSILLDPDQAPEPLSDLPRLTGLVAYARSEGYSPNGMQLFRIGIRFRDITETVRKRIHDVLGDLVTRRTPGDHDKALSLKPDGRELLYQTAFEHLERKRYVLARDLAILACRRETHTSWSLRGHGGRRELCLGPVPLGERQIVYRHPQLGERRQSVIVRADTPARVSVVLDR